MSTYSRISLIKSIFDAGIRSGDTVSLQVSIGRLGMPERARTFKDIADLVTDTFLEALGERGTLIVPTYTYSIGRGETFEVERTPSAIGEFAETFRHRAGVLRSRDPMLSNCGIGPDAKPILRDISSSCCGIGSVFHNLRKHNAKICTLGVGLYYATFIQHIEEMSSVPFRRHKVFSGKIKEDGIETFEEWTYFASPYLSNCVADPMALEKLAKKEGIVGISDVGRGHLFSVDANKYFDIGTAELKKNPWLTAMGPPCSEALILQHMNK